MSVFDFIKNELTYSGLTLKDLNKPKNKSLRYEYVNRAFIRFLETQPDLKKTNVIDTVRKETGLKFSNSKARTTYNELKQIKNRSTYAGKLKEGVLPDDSRIPLVKSRVTGEYIYGFTVYKYSSKDKISSKKLPTKKPKAIPLGGNGKQTYTSSSFWLFRSDHKLNRRDAENVAIAFLTGNEEDVGDILDYAIGSDPHKVFLGGRIVGFAYVSLTRT